MINNFNFKSIFKIVKRIPATLLLVLAVVLVGIFTKALWQSAESYGLVEKYGYGLPAFLDWQYWTIFVGAVVSPEPWMYATVLVPLLFGAGFLEYKFGALKMIVVLLLSHLISVLIVALALLVFSDLGFNWAMSLAKVRDVGLSNAGFGALGAATAGLSLAWRFRARASLIIYCLAFILYSGSIWDLTHFVGLLVGIIIGPWVVGKKFHLSRYKLSAINQRALLALLVVFYAVTHLVSKLYPGNGGLLAFNSSTPAEASSTVFVIIFCMLSLLFAYGLYSGRIIAWWAVTVVSIFLIMVNLGFGLNPNTIFNLIFISFILFLLFKYKKSFTVKPESYLRNKIVIQIIIVGIFIFVTHILAMYSMKNSYSPVPNFKNTVSESLYQSIGMTSNKFVAKNNISKITQESIDIIWIAFLISSLIAIVWATPRARNSRSQFDVYDKLMRSNGSSTVSWMARWNGMAYWANNTKTVAVAFRLINNVAIVLSNPVGSSKAISKATKEFEQYCNNNGWIVCYFSVEAKIANKLQKNGFAKIQIAEDTIIMLKNLNFTGKSWQSIRSAINKAEKLDIQMESIKYREAPLSIKDQLNSIAASWVSDKSLPEMGFTLGTLKEAEDPEVIMNIAVDKDGTVHGMTSWMPVYYKNIVIGRTIDIMQRRLDKQTMPGVIEFLIAKSAMSFKDNGLEFISLSAAPLSISSEAPNAIEKFIKLMSKKLEPYYGFKSLYNFKQKFSPEHFSLYLMYKDEAQLPAILAAISKAYMNDSSVISTVKNLIK